MIHEIGAIFSLINRIRKDKHISQRDLGRGICSGQQISKIENGEALPDFFMMELLLQRLGTSTAKFEIALSLEEYEEIEARDDILDDLRAGRLDEAEKKLENFCRDAGADQPVRKMNRARLLGLLALEREEYEAAVKYLKEAVGLTMGQAEQVSLNERLFAGIELETLILYGQALRAGHKGEEALELLQRVLDYVRKWITDSGERAKLQAKIAVVLGNIQREAGDYAACGALCEEALELLRDNDLIQCMPSLFELLLTVYESTGQQEKWERINCWKETLEQVYAHFGLSASMIDKLYFNSCTSQYYLIGEIIREERRAQGMSQEELMEGIYQEPATLSRVENGQMPDRKKLRQLMEKLGMSGWRYAGAVATEDYRVLEMNAEIEQLLCRHENEKAVWMAEQMKRFVDLSVPENRQQVEGLEIENRVHKDELNLQEAYSRSEELLRLTYHKKTERVPFRRELHLMNSMCMYLWRMERKEEAISEYQKIMERFEKSRVRIKYHFLSVGLILNNMSFYMAHVGHMEETERWSEKIAVQGLLNGKINTFHYVFNNLICVVEDGVEKQAGESVDFTSEEVDMLYDDAKKKCLQYIKWTIHITDIFKQHYMRTLFIKFAKENLGLDLGKY